MMMARQNVTAHFDDEITRLFHADKYFRGDYMMLASPTQLMPRQRLM